MTTVEYTITDRNGNEKTQKVPKDCDGCGYFYQDPNGEDNYYKCHYPDNEPSAWAPCNQDESLYDN